MMIWVAPMRHQNYKRINKSHTSQSYNKKSMGFQNYSRVFFDEKNISIDSKKNVNHKKV